MMCTSMLVIQMCMCFLTMMCWSMIVIQMCMCLSKTFTMRLGLTLVAYPQTHSFVLYKHAFRHPFRNDTCILVWRQKHIDTYTSETPC